MTTRKAGKSGKSGTAKAGTASARGPRAGAPADASQLAFGAARDQLALATDAAAILFRGAEAIREVQLDAAHRASQRHELVAHRLHSGCTPADIAGLQRQLLDFDLQGGAQYWQKITHALLMTQVELMACASHVVDGIPGMEPKAATAA